MILTAGIALLVVVALAIALATRLLRQPARDAVIVEPQIVGTVSQPLELPEPVITWTETLTTSLLDEAARLRLIDDLALLGAPWTIVLLHRAQQEESSPLVRARIDAALASSENSVSV